MDAITFVNGQQTHCLNAHDRGLAYGDGVFETIAIKHGQVQLWQAHQRRLIKGLLTLGIFVNKASAAGFIKTIITDIQQAFLLYGHQQAVLKITVTRGLGGRGYLAPSTPQPTRIIAITPWPRDRSQLAETGVNVRICQHNWSHNAALAGLKHLNRLDQVMARNEWEDEHIHEGIMLNLHGNVISGVMSNVFIESNGGLITPKLDQCGIAGVMAKEICAIAKQNNIAVEHKNIPLKTFINTGSPFLSNSLNGIWPINTLEPHAGFSHPTHWVKSTLIGFLQAAVATRLSAQPAVSELC